MESIRTKPILVHIVIMLFPFAPCAHAADWRQWRGPNRHGILSEQITWPPAEPGQMWEAAVGAGYSAVSISQGRVYPMGDVRPEDVVWCLDAKSGAVLWKYAYPSETHKEYPGPRATPTVDGQLACTVSSEGLLLALDAAKGAVMWSADRARKFGSKMPLHILQRN